MKNTLGIHAGLAGVVVLALAPALRPAPAPFSTCEPTPITFLPFPITESGVYCLTENLDGIVGAHGITVGALNVTIDLNGHTLQGVPGSLTGIECENIADLRVRNGTVRDWGEYGILSGNEARIEDVKLSGNGLGGVCGDEGVIIDRCSFRANGEVEVELDERSLVRDTTLLTNSTTGTVVLLGEESRVQTTRTFGGGTGISVGDRGSVVDCTVVWFEDFGIRVEDQGRIDRSQVGNPSGGQSVGLFLQTDGKVSDCAVEGTATGIFALRGALVRSTSVDEANVGMVLGDDGRVHGCLVKESLSLGIDAGERTAIVSTTVSGGPGAGINVRANSVVEHCLVSGTGSTAIRLADECIARGNTGSRSGGAGLVVDGDRCVVEGNALDSNQAGLDLNGVQTLTRGNRAANNAGADYSIPFGNPTGPTLNNTWWIQSSNPQANFRTPGF